jgi:short-subunit dehydrogenase
MECKPFNIHVMHLAPGSVKSNLSQNHSRIFNLPPTSLYKSFLDDIVRRMYVSQSAGCMDTKVFAERAVKRILARRPPRYLTLGGEVWAFRVLKALPRGIALAVLWWLFSRSK